MAQTVQQTLQDPNFYGLPSAEQQKVLATLDPNYARLPLEERNKVLQMGQQKLSAPTASSDFTTNTIDPSTGTGYGLYRMGSYDFNQGQVTKPEIQVPYNRVQDAMAAGYKLHPDEAPRYQKDITNNGPVSRATGQVKDFLSRMTTPLPDTPVTGNAWQQAIAAMGNVEKLPINVINRTARSVVGLPQGVAQTVSGISQGDPAALESLSPVTMAENMSRSASEDAADLGPMAALGNIGGDAATMYLTGKYGPRVVDPMMDVVKKAGRIPEAIARTATGTGDAPIEALVKDTRAANEKIADVNADRIERQQRDQAKADADHRSDLLKLRQKYEQQVRDATEKARTGTTADRDQYQAKQLAAKQKYEQDVRDAQTKYETKKTAAEQANDEAQRAYNRKIGQTVRQNRTVSEAQAAQSARASQLQVGGSQIISGLRQLDQNLRTRANAMYAAVRERMNNVSLPSDTLGDIVKTAQQKWIRGSPEKVREFNAMLSPADRGPELVLADQTAQNMGYKDFRSAITNPQIRSTLSRALPPDVWEAAMGQGTKPISWNDLQGFYEETGAKIADGPQPGKADIYKALQQVHEEIGNQMQQLADKQGVGEDFRNARSFYRDYMQTFHTPTGPSSSGSVVAQILRAKDPLIAAQKIASSAGERGIANLRRYDDNLANLAQDVQRTARSKANAPAVGRKSIADIPQPKVTPVPAGPSLPLPPVLESAPAPRSAALPLPPVLPEPETVPVELKPTKTISSPDIAGARQAAAESRRAWVNRRGAWVATWPIFEAMRALWGGHIPAIPTMALESAGTFATVRAASAMLNYPPMIKFLMQARPEDVALVPPELRGELPGLVNLARQRGVHVAPALVTAVAAGTTGQNKQTQPALAGGIQ